MRTPMVLATLLALAVVAPLIADEQGDRNRKARVALALAGARTATVAIAPAPRPVEPKLTYVAGHKAATVEQTPLVVFVGMSGPNPANAIVSKTDQLGDVTAPAVVIAYPIGDRLYLDAVIRAKDATPEVVQRAVDAAGRKLETPAKQMPPPSPAPKPLDWQIRDTSIWPAILSTIALVASTESTQTCACGPACECRNPGQRPSAAVPPGYGAAPTGYEWWRDSRGPDGWGLRQVGLGELRTTPSIAPAAAPYRLPTAPQFPFGPPSCPNGRCPNIR